MIKTSDTYEQLNSTLEREYRASLFDFSYFFAISLNKKFWLQPLADLKKEEYERGKKFLENTYKKSADYQFLEDIRESLRNKIEKINRVIVARSKGAGRYLGNRSRLVLLWSQILKKPKKRREAKKIPLGKEVYMIKKVEIEREEINWNDLYDLKRWFYSRFKNCLYSKNLKVTLEPSPNIRKREIAHEKSLWEKNYKNHYQEINNEILILRRIQEYFKDKKKKFPIILGKNKWIYLERHPMIIISFKKDSIEIGELRKNGIMLKKYNVNQKVTSEKLKKSIKISCPTVIFPNGDKFEISEYTPPGDLSAEVLNKYLDEFMKEILGN